MVGSNAKNCRKTRFCKVCSGKHPTILHGSVRKKVDSSQHQCNSEASEERKDGKVAACSLLNIVFTSSKVKAWGLWQNSEDLCTFG